ncbi:MAG: hypothetical protein ACUVT6_11950 [Thermodesulfobacteriota bacterium]
MVHDGTLVALCVGFGIGVLSWITFLLSDKPIGCSTAFSRTSGMLERLFQGDRVKEKTYYTIFSPEVDWEWMLVLGVFLGALISALFPVLFVSFGLHRNGNLPSVCPLRFDGSYP